MVCIFMHDWGYWGKANMDDEEGERHPELAADIAWWLFRFKSLSEATKYYYLCLLHSRHLSRKLNMQPSLLCWADKASIRFEPRWFYLLRAWLSGELHEYRRISAETGFLPLTASHKEWFAWIKARQIKLGVEQRGDVVSYANRKRTEKGPSETSKKSEKSEQPGAGEAATDITDGTDTTDGTKIQIQDGAE